MKSVLPTTEAPLVAALRRLSMGVLYTLGDRRQLFEALSLCQGKAVRLPQWSQDRSRLSLKVVSAALVEVCLEMRGEELISSCECRDFGGRGTCVHRLAALLTLKKALEPQSLSGWRADAATLNKIREVLLFTPEADKPVRLVQARKVRTPSSRSKPADEFAVVLEERFGTLMVELLRNGAPCLPHAQGIPADLQGLLHELWTYGRRPLETLARLLEQGERPWPLLWRDARGALTRLRVEQGPTQECLLLLDAEPHGVRIQRTLEAGGALGEQLTRLDNWLLDVDNARLVRAFPAPTEGLWNSLREAAKRLDGQRGWLLAWEGFRGIEVFVNAGQDARENAVGVLRLLVRGDEQNPLDAGQLRYGVDVVAEASTGFVKLRAWALASDYLGLDLQALALFTEDFQGKLSAMLRAYKRRRILYESFFAARAATTKTARVRILRAALQGPDFRKRALVREAREVLEYMLLRDGKEAFHLNFSDQHWQLWRRNRDQEARLLEIFYAHFDEAGFRGASTPGEARVPAKEFFAALPALLSDLGGAGFELRFQGQPVHEAPLDIEVSARATEIDWFELRPEIRCSGELLDERLWRQALEQGLVAAGGKLHLLSAQSREALAILAGLAGPASKTRREIMRIPRLHILDLLSLRRLGARLRLSPEDEAILHNLENFDQLPPQPEPSLRACLRDYQRQGYQWLAFLYGHKFGACLADDMGLGKTLQAISLLAALGQGVLASRVECAMPHLVVVPPSLLFNWESELARFAPQLRSLVYRGQGRNIEELRGAEVVLSSYDIVRRDIEELAHIDFHVIVFDEAQVVKNVHAAATTAARRLRGTFKLALTGTPVENHLGEYWSIIDLVLPGLLGEYRRFGNGRDEPNAAELRRLIARTRPFVLRRTKEKIAAELPDKVEIDQHLELSPAQKILYQQTVAQVRDEIAGAWGKHNQAQARISALAALTRLRRLCLDPRLVGGAATEDSPKIAALCELLEELRAEGHAVLVFSQFTSFLDLVEARLGERGMDFLRLDGATPVPQRKKLVEGFQKSSAPLVFLLSLKAGGRGLNLTRASYVIHLDPWWNPAVENQASDRAHRIGQSRKVTVVRLLMRHTVEEKMMLLKERKAALFKALLEEGRDAGAMPLSREDFEFLVGG